MKSIGLGLQNSMFLRTITRSSKVPVLSLERALYLAKEAGVFTTKEMQTHVIKSPSFSTSNSPFLLEDFFSSIDDVDHAQQVQKAKEKNAPDAASKKDQATRQTVLPENDSDVNPSQQVEQALDPIFTPAHPVIHSALLRAFNPHGIFMHNGREYKTKAEGKGSKKRAVAHAIITQGTGKIRVNKVEDFVTKWPLLYNRFDVIQPFLMTRTSGVFDLHLSVRGGGSSGQSCAARLAVARALVDACSECSLDMKDSLALFEDTRQKVSKRAGRNSAFGRDKNKK